MAIAHLTSYFFPDYNGGTTRMYNILSRMPYDILLVTSDRLMDGKAIEPKDDVYGNICVRRLPVLPEDVLKGTPVNLLHYLDSYHRIVPGKVARALAGDEITLVHAHNTLPLGAAGMKLSRAHGCPFVFELHAVIEDYFTGLNQYFWNTYLQRETLRLIRHSDHLMCLTGAQKRWIADRYRVQADRITVLPNAVDSEMFRPEARRPGEVEELRRRLGVRGKVVMYAGYIDHINGLDDLASVVPDVIERRPDVTFVIIGQGPDEGIVRALAKRYPQVRCLNRVPYEEMTLYYAMSDVFVIPRPSTPSAEIIVPLKLLEAMSMGRLVLGSDVGGIAEIIRPGENGLLFRKGDRKSLLEVLVAALDTDVAEIGRRARKTILDGFTWDRSAELLRGVYESLPPRQPINR